MLVLSLHCSIRVTLPRSGVSLKATALELYFHILMFCIYCINSKYYLRTTHNMAKCHFWTALFSSRTYSKSPCSFPWNNTTASKQSPFFPTSCLWSMPHTAARVVILKYKITFLCKTLQGHLIKKKTHKQTNQKQIWGLSTKIWKPWPPPVSPTPPKTPSFLRDNLVTPFLLSFKYVTSISMPMANALVSHAYLMKPPEKKKKTAKGQGLESFWGWWTCEDFGRVMPQRGRGSSAPCSHTLPSAPLPSGCSWAIHLYNKPVIWLIKCSSEFCEPI